MFKFNPITGKLDSTNGPDNYSYKTIDTDLIIDIPEHQEMSVYDEIFIVGDLVINGDLVVFSFKKFRRQLTDGKPFAVQLDREFTSFG